MTKTREQKNIFDLEQYDLCKYAKLLAGNRFIYLVNNCVYKLFCYNGKTWTHDTTLFKNFLSNFVDFYNIMIEDRKLILYP
mgnify:CR=1 FL=1